MLVKEHKERKLMIPDQECTVLNLSN